MRSLVVVGASAPIMATVRRMRKSIKIHLVNLKSGVLLSRRPRIGIEPGSASLDVGQVGTADGMAVLKAFTEKVNADAIASSDDWTLLCLARHRALFGPGCRVLAPDADALQRLWDKFYQIHLAEKCGLNVLPTYSLKSAKDQQRFPATLFPP